MNLYEHTIIAKQDTSQVNLNNSQKNTQKL